MDLFKVLAECIDEVASGRASVEDCVARYPQYAGELRPMLELALNLRAVPRVRMRRQAFLSGREKVVSAARVTPAGGSPLVVLLAPLTRLARRISMPPAVVAYAAVALAIVLSLALVVLALGLGMPRKVPADHGTVYPVVEPSPFSGEFEPVSSPLPTNTPVPVATEVAVVQEPTPQPTAIYRPTPASHPEPARPRPTEPMEKPEDQPPAFVPTPRGDESIQPTTIPEPTDIPTPKREVKPTEPPTPRETAEPTRTPRPTKTAKPTETPEPTETPHEEETPHPEEHGTPEPEKR